MRMAKTNFDITGVQCIGHGGCCVGIKYDEKKNSLNKRERFEYRVCMR